MEIMMINENKLKIMLDYRDLAEFDMEVEDLDYRNTETKQMLWEILRRAKRTVGFDTDGSRLLVQVYPSRDGSCEIFITKLETAESEATGGNMGQKQEKEASFRRGKPWSTEIPSNTLPVVFAFDCLEWLICVCRRLQTIGYRGNSSVYISDECRYYLLIDRSASEEDFSLNEYSFITEYGSREPAETLRVFLAEHGTIICQANAIEQLSRL